jgi:hypothetical protein
MEERLMTADTFVRLGSGSFATVFVGEGRGCVVLKQVHDPTRNAELDKEHADLRLLHEVCCGSDALFVFPRPFGFYRDYLGFARETGTEDPGPSAPSGQLHSSHALYVMQRMWPVPLGVAGRIRDEFFPEGQKVAPFLARLYLGRARSSGRSRFFCAENFPLDAERIERLGLPSRAIAEGMGQTLGRINFRAGRDGRDVEFVLCGDPDNPLSKHPGYACIDFNQMRPHGDDAGVIVDSIVTNDPYYPRPPSPHWSSFAAAYLREAEEADADAAADAAAEAAADRPPQTTRHTDIARAVLEQLHPM